MMDLWELSAREEIRELVATYATNVDSGRFDAVLACFAPDGSLEPDGAIYQGHEAIGAMFDRAFTDVSAWPHPITLRHMVGSLQITVESPTSARSRCYYAVFMGHGLDHWGHYDDTYCIVDGAWKFAQRREFMDGMTKGGWAEMVTSAKRGS